MSRVALIISSYDGFADCWPAVAHGLTKYWPDLPYPIYLISNFEDFDHPNIAVIKLGEDASWSDNLSVALSQIDATYVLFFLEDYWLTTPVDTQRIESYVDLMEREGINYIRLLAYPVPDYDFPADPRIGLIAREGEYRTSTQVALWRRNVLRELLVSGESVWQFELEGTARSRRYGDTFLSVKPYEGDPYHWGVRYVCTAINRGRWARAAVRYADTEGLAIDFSQRPVETWWHEFMRSEGLGTQLAVVGHRLRVLLHDPSEFLRKTRTRLVGPRQTR